MCMVYEEFGTCDKCIGHVGTPMCEIRIITDYGYDYDIQSNKEQIIALRVMLSAFGYIKFEVP